ncbi:MAG: S8 family serine peptidase [Dehalococcoidia bacterium]
MSPDPQCYGDQQWAPQKIDAPGAWSVTTGSSGVAIAVIDTGVDLGHDDLYNKMLSQTDYTGTGGTGDGCVGSPGYGHGTVTSGITAADTDNAEGVAGVGWDSLVRSYKVLETVQGVCVFGENCGALAQAIQDAANQGVKVINISLRGCYQFGLAAEQEAINYAWYTKGVVVVASAGNSYSNQGVYPAGYDNVIAVGGTDAQDNRWVTCCEGSNAGTWVDISAPAASILSTSPQQGYAKWSGTSMASPHVAGVAALLASMGLNHCEIVNTILDPANVDPINWEGGVGRVNADEAVDNPKYLPWTVPAGDGDCDGFTSAHEITLGTDPEVACGFTPGGSGPPDSASDTWPADIVESNHVNVQDVLAVKPYFGQAIPPAPVRYDIVLSGNINSQDALALSPFIGGPCTP